MIGTDDRIDARQLTDRVRQRDHDLSAVEAGFIHDVMVGMQARVWLDDGHRSIHAWLRATTHWSDPRINRVVRNARLCRSAPAVLDALRAGRVTVDRVDVLGRAYANPRVRDQLVAYVDDFVEHAAGVPHRVFELMVRNWVDYIDLDGAHHDAEAAHDARHLVLTDTGDGTLVLRGELTGVQAAQLRHVLDAYAHAEFLIDHHHALACHGDGYVKDQLARTHRQRLIDALVHIAHDAATHATHSTTDDSDDGPAVPAPASPEPELIVHTNLANLTKLIELLGPTTDQTLALHGIGSLTLQQLNSQLAAGTDPARLAAHTTDGVPIAPADLLAALIIGKLRLVVEDDAGIILHAGRTKRLFTGTQRDLVLAAALRCVFAGCTTPSTRCQADHLHPHSHHGPTDIDNGGPGCRHHNNWRHHHGYTITRDTHGHWHTWRPDGTEL